MRIGQGVKTGLGHGGITCVLHTQFSSFIFAGSLTLSQLPVICRHLGELFGLSPDSADDKLQAEQICHTCHDYLVEGIDVPFLS